MRKPEAAYSRANDQSGVIPRASFYLSAFSYYHLTR
jgi:hypothetical protein